ncbi:Urea-proton symporter DUR3 [Leucoagaricus sp. SymC.cos]|nr:Urea-proton symporter DUR3 [Leucoagaricus sp. SymC.cos]
MSDTAVLPQGAGYGVVIGIGLFFSTFMICLTALQTRYTAFSPKDSEEFSTASRSVKPGLIASGIVSAWTWAATLLQSCAVAYKFGISGPWWYGAGACVQILLFAMLAAKLKLNAPYAHTWLEIVGVRWGKAAHLVFMFFGFATNIIVSSMLILGGSATVTDLTGMNTIAACFLIPIGVAIYVVVGGMRSTLLCDYTHTVILFVIIFVSSRAPFPSVVFDTLDQTFTFTVYATSPKIGSPTKMHELLATASSIAPVEGNAHGSYLTMRSKNGIIFGVINIIGNFATVFQDQAYWQRAIASRPATTVKAYLLGGLAWFAIPFTFATTLGLAAVALRGDPDMRVLSPADVSAGLPAAAAAAALLGKGGAAAILILLFLAVTSACSAELIASSSLLTYDVYVKYFNPKANEGQVLRMGHCMYPQVAFWAIVCGVAGTIFFYIGVSMGWLYTFMGVILGSGVAPIALCITWSKANKWGCIGGSILGFFCGLIAWLVTTAKLNDGVINVVTSGGDYEMLAGNLASILIGAVVAVVTSLIVAFWAIVCGVAGTIFFYIGVSMGWLYTFMGVILGSGVAPIALCVTWSKANKWGCIGGSILGFFCGLIAWLVTTAKLNDGVINVVTSGGDYEMLAGNLASILIGAVVAVVTSLIWPDDYDWEATRTFNKPEPQSESPVESIPSDRESLSEKKDTVTTKAASVTDSFDAAEQESELDPAKLKKAFHFASWSSLGLFVILILLIPLPLFGSARVYNVKDLTAWVSIGIAWTFFSSFAVVLYPLYESRTALGQIGRGIVKDIFAGGSGKYVSPVKSAGA